MHWGVIVQMEDSFFTTYNYMGNELATGPATENSYHIIVGPVALAP